MSWLRHNRFWLPLVPVCLALVLVASGYRVKDLWWDAGLHRVEASAAAGKPVTVTDDYTDAFGKTSRTFTLQLTGVRTQKRLPGFDGPTKGDRPPAGTDAVAADLSWSAEPDVAMDGCTVALVDDQGRRYEILKNSFQSGFCVPDDHGGPAIASSKAHPRGYVEPGTERPATWTTSPVFAVPEGVHVTSVLVWWSEPHYVELAAP